MNSITFDGTRITFDPHENTVTVDENGVRLELVANGNMVKDARWNVDGMLRAGSISEWVADRIVFCFGIAARKLA